MNYYINIAIDSGRKLFGTDDPAYTHWGKLNLGQLLEKDAYKTLTDTRERYPSPQFKCSLYQERTVGTLIDAG